MEAKELEQLISFHEAGLAQYKFVMSPSTIVLEEMTIKALKELQSIKKASSSSTAVPES